jgi:hypothetical protein
MVVVFGWLLGAQVLPAMTPHQPAAAYWAVAVPGAVALIAALLAHELAHSLVARRYGVPVTSITLWALGGISELGGEPPTARPGDRPSGPDRRLRTAGAACSVTSPAAPKPARQHRRSGRRSAQRNHQPPADRRGNPHLVSGHQPHCPDGATPSGQSPGRSVAHPCSHRRSGQLEDYHGRRTPRSVIPCPVLQPGECCLVCGIGAGCRREPDARDVQAPSQPAAENLEPDPKTRRSAPGKQDFLPWAGVACAGQS